MAANWWTTLCDLVYPPKCPGCKATVAEHGAWCSNCQRQIIAVRTLSMPEHHLVALDSCRVVCAYTGRLKRIIHDMKFRQQQGYGICLGWLIHKHMGREMFADLDYVIPVPLHAQRFKERGYNQTEAIFKDWSQCGEWRWMPELLVRVRPTIPQWELNLLERKANITGAFVAQYPEKIQNKKMILVDDLLTTGITLDECANVLKQAGAKAVHALVLASGAR